jgi:branched-chain amino acid aminotransferase
MTFESRSAKLKHWCWINDALLPEDRAHVSLFDRGYLYGDGLFETLRAYGGKVFRLERHFARLKDSAREIGLSWSLNLQQLERIVTELLHANDMSDAYLRFTVSRGIGVGPLPSVSVTPTNSLFLRPLNLPSPMEYENGWKGLLVESSLSAGAQLSRLKSLNYLDKVLAKMKAREAGAQEAVLTNSRGEITEAATCNLFILKGRRLLTPPLSAGLLPGITREAIIELAPVLSLEPEETALRPDDLFTSDECFLTNSIIEIMPLTELDGKWIGDGRRGPLSATCQRAYRELVRRELNG